MRNNILLLLTFCLGLYRGPVSAQPGQNAIVNIRDERLPEDLKTMVRSLKSVSAVERFQYDKEYTTADTVNTKMTIKERIRLSFTDGKLTGSIQETRTLAGNPPITREIPMDICILYCCTFRSDKKEHCTTDLATFKKWDSDGNCSDSRTTTCQ